MHNPDTDAWQAAYVAAVLESDPHKLLEGILEAQFAIQQRLLNGPSPDALESRGIKAAWAKLAGLKSQFRSIDLRVDLETATPLIEPDSSPSSAWTLNS